VQTAYVASGTPSGSVREPPLGKRERLAESPGRGDPSPQQSILLQQGDSLLLTRAQTAGKPATLNRQGKSLRPATIPCTLPEVFNSIRRGERIWFDDGKIGGIIRTAAP